jgi:hypothetical protein
MSEAINKAPTLVRDDQALQNIPDDEISRDAMQSHSLGVVSSGPIKSRLDPCQSHWGWHHFSQNMGVS